MTDDEQEDRIAYVAAHDMMLTFLTAQVIQLFPVAKRQELIEAVLKMPDLPVPEGMARDLDGADRLAGITQKTKANMQRIVAAAVAATNER